MQDCLEVCGGQGPNPEYGKKFFSLSIYCKVNKKTQRKLQKITIHMPYSITLMSWSTVLRRNLYEIRKQALLRLTRLRLNCVQKFKFIGYLLGTIFGEHQLSCVLVRISQIFPSMAFKFVYKTGMFICVFTELRDFSCNKSQINPHSIAGLGSRINQLRLKLLLY